MRILSIYGWTNCSAKHQLKTQLTLLLFKLNDCYNNLLLFFDKLKMYLYPVLNHACTEYDIAFGSLIEFMTQFWWR